ncbi:MULTISPECIES: heme-binding protein [Mycolicibacterium]|uniref:heme-binding protein n=1 Tax=Mycolicibacterium TaxID=1866885 RepID=UPI000686BEA8|nr:MULTISPECIES: heme-binding protein [Mycolicibacterium]
MIPIVAAPAAHADICARHRVRGRAAASSVYLFTHPELNGFFTGLHGPPHEEVPQSTRGYFDTHPQEHAELRGIRQPLVDFRNRCGYGEPNLFGGQQP